jgi:RimJ/RimL family protein N-acetyltransferase
MSLTAAPILHTGRLVLRGHVEGDFAACAAMWADPLVVRYIGGRPFSNEESWGRVLRYIGHWAVLGYGYWTVRDRATDRYLGEVGFADFKRDIDPTFDGAPEAGWVFAPEAHGRGLATEAMAAAHAWLDTVVKPVRTVCIINTDHVASIRVGAKLGYREWTRTTYKGSSVNLFERRRTP